MVSPPSTIRVYPVTKLASSEARNMTVRAISSGVPMRPNSEAARSTSSCPVVTSVAIQPGETPLARMRCGAPWTASARVSASTAALAMPEVPQLPCGRPWGGDVDDRAATARVQHRQGMGGDVIGGIEIGTHELAQTQARPVLGNHVRALGAGPGVVRHHVDAAEARNDGADQVGRLPFFAQVGDHEGRLGAGRVQFGQHARAFYRIVAA